MIEKSNNIRISQGADEFPGLVIGDIQAVDFAGAHLLKSHFQGVTCFTKKRRREHDVFEGGIDRQACIIGPHDIGFRHHTYRLQLVINSEKGVHLVFDNGIDAMGDALVLLKADNLPPHGFMDTEIS